MIRLQHYWSESTITKTIKNIITDLIAEWDIIADAKMCTNIQQRIKREIRAKKIKPVFNRKGTVARQYPDNTAEILVQNTSLQEYPFKKSSNKTEARSGQ